MIPIGDLTDVTLAIEDTDEYDEVDEDDEDDEEDLTDETLVSGDTYWRHDYWLAIEEVMKVIKWWKLSSDEKSELFTKNLRIRKMFENPIFPQIWKFSSMHLKVLLKVA